MLLTRANGIKICYDIEHKMGDIVRNNAAVILIGGVFLVEYNSGYTSVCLTWHDMA